MSRQANVKPADDIKPKVNPPTAVQKIQTLRANLIKSETDRIENLEKTYNIIKKLRLEENLYFLAVQTNEQNVQADMKNKIASLELKIKQLDEKDLKNQKLKEINEKKAAEQIKNLQTALSANNKLLSIPELVTPELKKT
jgi:hypothetical protein